MRHTESSVLVTYDKFRRDHKDLHTLQRVGWLHWIR